MKFYNMVISDTSMLNAQFFDTLAYHDLLLSSMYEIFWLDGQSGAEAFEAYYCCTQNMATGYLLIW